MYTVKEFRANLRKALNEARDGEKVIVERWGELFELRPVEETVVKDQRVRMLDGSPLPNVITDRRIPPLVEPEDPQLATERDASVVEPVSSVQFCKHGAVKGFCKKGCK